MSILTECTGTPKTRNLGTRSIAAFSTLAVDGIRLPMGVSILSEKVMGSGSPPAAPCETANQLATGTSENQRSLAMLQSRQLSGKLTEVYIYAHIFLYSLYSTMCGTN